MSTRSAFGDCKLDCLLYKCIIKLDCMSLMLNGEPAPGVLETPVRPVSLTESHLRDKSHSHHATDQTHRKSLDLIHQTLTSVKHYKGLTEPLAESYVHVTLHIPEQTDNVMRYYASVLVDGWLEMKTETFAIDETQDIWLISVPVFFSKVNVTTTLDSRNGAHLCVSDPQKIEILQEPRKVVISSMKHNSPLCALKGSHEDWSAHIILVPVDENTSQQYLRRVDAQSTHKDVYDEWATYGNELRRAVGSMTNSPTLHLKLDMKVENFEKLQTQIEVLTVHLYQIYQALHLTYDNPLLKLIETHKPPDDHGKKDIQEQLRLGPAKDDSPVNVSDASPLVDVKKCAGIHGKINISIISKDVVNGCKSLNKVWGPDLTALVHETTKGKKQAASRMSITKLLEQRAKVCQDIEQKVEERSTMQDDTKIKNNIKEVRGMYLAVNCIDDCIISNVNCMFSLPGGQDSCIHPSLLREWSAYEEIDDVFETKLSDIMTKAMESRPGPYHANYKTEICHQILKYRFIKSLDDSIPRIQTSKGWRYTAGFISTEHTQMYNDKRPDHTLDIHQRLMRLAPTVDADRVVWDMVLKGLVQLQIMSAHTHTFIVNAGQQISTRNSEREDTVKEQHICHIVSGIFRPDSPLFSLAQRMLSSDVSVYKTHNLPALLNQESVPHLLKDKVDVLNMKSTWDEL